MKKQTKTLVIQLLYAALFLAMAVQILLGILWMMKNIHVIPIFGDSTEYLNLSETLALDEYRPILYPLVLRYIQKLGSLSPVPFQTWLYLFQTAVSFATILYSLSILDRVILKVDHPALKRRGLQIFFSLYLMTIPMMTFMNFCVLTDSLATSMLLVFLANLVLLFSREQLPVKNYVLMAAVLLIECLLRADRLYSCLLLTVIAFVIKLVRDRRNRTKTVAAMLCVCLLVPGITKGVGWMTQTPRLNGRIETNLDFILLDRIVWPNMTANYDSFPKEMKEMISLEDAKTFDKHNNNVMYQMAPLVEEKVGKEKAGQMYRQMAKIVFTNQTKKVLRDMGEDIAAMALTPISSLLNAKGLCDKGDSWNVHCMSTQSPELTRLYNTYYQYSFLILLSLGILFTLLAIIKKEDRNIRPLLRKMMPFWGMGIIFTLWFCLGDGAPPNDRYALIIYINWSILTAGLLGFWLKEPAPQKIRKV